MKEKKKLVIYLEKSNKMVQAQFQKKKKYSIQTMQKNILKKCWVYILKRRGLFIKVHVDTLQQNGIAERRIEISSKLLGPSWSQLKFLNFLREKLFNLQLI